MAKIVWLASYPRSGNTWTLIMLNELIQCGAANLTLAVGAERLTLERWAGLDFEELGANAQNAARAAAWSDISDEADGLVVSKLHDRWSDAELGGVIPSEATHGVIHVVRHPEDVAASLGPFLGLGIDETIDLMADDTCTFGGAELPHVTQDLGSWSGHAESWLESGLPVLTVAYEALIADPVRSLGEMATHMGLTVSPDDLSLAVEASSFDALQSNEDRFGSGTPAGATDRYFRRGKAGSGAKELSIEQRTRIGADHQATMRRLGYVCSATELGEIDGLERSGGWDLE